VECKLEHARQSLQWVGGWVMGQMGQGQLGTGNGLMGDESNTMKSNCREFHISYFFPLQLKCSQVCKTATKQYSVLKM